MPRLTNDGKLDELMKKAMKLFNQLTPEEQAAHRREQAISWVKGQALLHHYESGKPDLTEEEVAKMVQDIADQYDRKLPQHYASKVQKT